MDGSQDMKIVPKCLAMPVWLPLAYAVVLACMDFHQLLELRIERVVGCLSDDFFLIEKHYFEINNTCIFIKK